VSHISLECTLAINYRSLKFLIIDNYPPFRMSLKGMIQQMGGSDVTSVTTGEDAVKKCSKERFDIILSDYDLGDGKDGQQVLEELKHHELLKPTSVFIMVTAENTLEMVMAALEHVPDSYLTKPFTRDNLESRLTKLLTKKLALSNIFKSISSKNYTKAIATCNKLILSGSNYATSCLRIRADLADKMGDFGQSKQMYKDVIKSKPLTWALMGLAKIHYREEEFEDSNALLQQVLKIMKTYPEALDWQARVQLAQHHPNDAQETLQSAVKLSPKSVRRQVELGDLALQNGNVEIARKAYKAAVKCGRTSVYKSPDSYLKLVSILTTMMSVEGGMQNRRLVEEAMRVLKELTLDYQSDAEVMLRANLARHAIAHKLEKTGDAEDILQQSKLEFEKLKEALSGDSCIDMAQACKDGGDFESCQNILSNILDKFGDDQKLMANLELIIDDRKAFDLAVKASKFNTQAMKAFSNNEINTAIEGFDKALKISPDNISFNLNLTQILLKKLASESNKTKVLEQIKGCLDKCNNLRDSDPRLVRYEQLLRLYNDLLIGTLN